MDFDLFSWWMTLRGNGEAHELQLVGMLDVLQLVGMLDALQLVGLGLF